MIPDSTALLQYKIVGGSAQQAFDDAKDPGVANWPVQFMLSGTAPITKIVVASGYIVDNLHITYKLATGASVDRSHGGTGGSKHSTVTLNPNEVLVGVSGRAGIHPYYNQDYLIEVSFVIFNTSTEQTRVEGPFGNDQKVTTGTIFYMPRPAAFAGYVRTTGQTGIAGLSAYRITK